MKRTIDFLIRFLYLVIGAFLMGTGARLASASQFGADVVVLVWDGLYKTFGIDMGMANIIVSIVFLTFTFFCKKKYIGFGTVAGVFLQSAMMHYIHFESIQTAPMSVRFVAMVIGVSLIAMGCSVYAIAELGVGPYVGVILSSNARFGWSITRVKFHLDALCVIVGLALGIFPSIGPVFSLVASGFIMDGTMQFLKFILRIQEKTSDSVEQMA